MKQLRWTWAGNKHVIPRFPIIVGHRVKCILENPYLDLWNPLQCSCSNYLAGLTTLHIPLKRTQSGDSSHLLVFWTKVENSRLWAFSHLAPMLVTITFIWNQSWTNLDQFWKPFCSIWSHCPFWDVLSSIWEVLSYILKLRSFKLHLDINTILMLLNIVFAYLYVSWFYWNALWRRAQSLSSSSLWPPAAVGYRGDTHTVDHQYIKKHPWDSGRSQDLSGMLTFMCDSHQDVGFH